MTKSPVLKPFFSAVSTAASDVPSFVHSSIKAVASKFVLPIASANGWFATMAIKDAPNNVSGRVVNTSIVWWSAGASLSSLNRTRAPSDLPIQFLH